MYYQGTLGLYWSSTAYSSATNAYYLDLNISGAVNPAYTGSKYYGFSLRCLATLESYTSFPNHQARGRRDEHLARWRAGLEQILEIRQNNMG